MKKLVVLLIVLFAAGFFHISYNTKLNSRPDSISGAWLEENLSDVTLELYYLSPYTLTRKALSVADLMRSCDIHITVDTETMKEHKDLICQMLETPTTPTDNDKTYLNARICYILCTKNGETLLEIAMWGMEENEVFVNGIPCVTGPIFYDVAIELLPSDAATEFKNYVANMRHKDDSYLD